MPTISIAMTTCNGDAYLVDQIESILNQSFSDFELLIWDDASSDGTLAIARHYAGQDSRIRIFVQPQNVGVQANMASVLAACTGTWIAPCDQDDIWHPAKLEILFNRVTSDETLLGYCDSELVDANGQSLGQTLFDQGIPIQGGDPLAFAFGNTISGHAMLFHRSLLAECLPLPPEPMYDWWIGAVAAAKGRFSVEPTPLVRFRQHARSITDRVGMRKVKKPFAEKRARISKRKQTFDRRMQAFAQLPGEAGEHYRQISQMIERHHPHGWRPAFGLATKIWRLRFRVFTTRKRSLLRDSCIFLRFLIY